MNEKTNEQIALLLSDPQNLIQKKPFTRGIARSNISRGGIGKEVSVNDVVKAVLPNFKKKIITQDEYLQELDPASHKVLFDDNIPSITMKTKDGGYLEIEYKRMSVPYQILIRDKQTLHLCGNPMQFTLMNTAPDDKMNSSFSQFKQYWTLRNMDGMRNKMVSKQKSMGDSGLLFYFDYKGQVKARLLCYEDGYVLCPHEDDNGDRILESVYYQNERGEFIDSYDDKYMYRWQKLNDEEGTDDGEWELLPKEEHGFSEIPLITKRGRVAWDNVQNMIEVYEVIYNIFLVIQKRHGWGILYIKGQFKDKGQKLAGAIVLNDTSLDGNGSAEFKTPPSPQNMIDTLGLMDETIQKGGGATFILPKDVKSSGDISAQAIMLTQSRDIETAVQGVIDWQNVADKMCRLFKEGLAKELVKSDKNPTAITDFEQIDINAKFKVWRPHNDTEYNNMIISLKQSGCISAETAIEKNTESSPDEKQRVKREIDESLAQKQKELKKMNKANPNAEENIIEKKDSFEIKNEVKDVL